MAQPADRRPDLRAAPRSSDPVVATNAAILLSRQHDPAAYEPLLRSIRSGDTNTWQRLAAIEAFSELDWQNVVVELRRLVDQYGKFTGDDARSYQPDLHAELLHALARALKLGWSTGDPRFAAALESPAANVRREALTEFSQYGPLPANISRSVGDPDSNVRRAALHTLAVRRHPEVLELLRRALLDQDLLVRLSAIADFGLLGQPEAVAELRQLAAKGTELVRAAAVAALVTAGDDQIVSTAIGDKSWRVRRALVPILDRPQNAPRPTDFAERLVADVNPDVAQAAIHSVGHWELTRAGPILLTAMQSRIYVTRKTAAEQLAQLWPPANTFEVEAVEARRAAEMEQLWQQWRSQSPENSQATAAAPPATGTKSSASAADTAARIARVQALLDQLSAARQTTATHYDALLNSLAAIGPDLPELLQQIHQQTGQPLPADIYGHVLPAVRPEFATIQRLTSSDVRERRQAADALNTQTLQSSHASWHKPLCALALDRLVELMIREPDTLVWSSIFESLADDDREPARRLAYAALSHPSPEVRRRACEYLAAHPDAAHGPLLAKSLADPDAAVVEAAVRAIGRLPSLDDPRPLEKILAAADHALRVEAAESLARLGFASGAPALERLGYDPAPKVRRMAAAAMGRIGDRSFVPVLVHLLDDRPEVSRAALASLPRAAGRDAPPPHAASGAANTGDAALPPSADSEQAEIRRWKEWYAASTTLALPR